MVTPACYVVSKSSLVSCPVPCASTLFVSIITVHYTNGCHHSLCLHFWRVVAAILEEVDVQVVQHCADHIRSPCSWSLDVESIRPSRAQRYPSLEMGFRFCCCNVVWYGIPAAWFLSVLQHQFPWSLGIVLLVPVSLPIRPKESSSLSNWHLMPCTGSLVEIFTIEGNSFRAVQVSIESRLSACLCMPTLS
jgi:hypothetical protein